MAKGTEFEAKALEYLKSLFELMRFDVTAYERQQSGTQNGFDICIGFLDDSGKERKFFFECKDYKTDISWDNIGVKIHQLYASSHRPDAFIALSPYVNFSNIQRNVIDNLKQALQTPIFYWTPATNVQKYFSVDASFYEYVYREQPAITESDKKDILRTIRGIITDILRQKDKLIGGSYTKELTRKIPRINNDEIVGREDELKELYHLLFDNAKQVVVVNGLGGIGKTTLAQGYISKYLKDYRNVVWITQLTNDIISDIANAEGLAENLSISREGKDTDQIFNEIISKLKAIKGGPNLLILDNVEDNFAKLKDCLPGQPNWHVLTTSRKQIDGFYIKELDFLSPKKALALFRKHCSLIWREDEIAELLKVIDYHTLTIEILAKTAQRQRTNIEVLKKAMKDDLKANVTIPHKGNGEKIDKVRSYLSSIFNLSDLDEDETWLMKQFTCLPAEYHTYDRLLELIDPNEDKKKGFAEIYNRLVEQGWLLYNRETDAYKMHLVVQEVAIQQLQISIDDVSRLLLKVAENLKIDQSKDNPIDKFKWIPFGYAALNNFQDDVSATVAYLQNNLALRLQNLGQYEQARELLQKAMISNEKNFGPDHPATAACYSNLGSVLQDLGQYELARELLQKAILSIEKNFGLNHPSMAVRYVNLAMVLKDLGQYEEARELLQKAMISNEKNFGPDHPATAVCYSNLATVLKHLGQYEQARELLQKAMLLAEKNFGSDHPTTAVRYSNLATVLQELGQYEQARELLQKAIRSDEKNFGPDHPTTAVSYSNLATLLKTLKKYTEAFELSNKSLLIFKKTLPDGHPYIDKTQNFCDSIRSKL
jgi:tetratricopeptide (TPR) repeat protein